MQSGSFSCAASTLGLTKASIWQQVRALEKEFGCRLLQQRGKRMELTAEGERLAVLSAPLVAGFDSIKSTFQAELEAIPPQLSVATTPSCLAHELREPILETRRTFPGAHLKFQDRNSPAAIEMLASGEVDVAVAARFEEWPEKPLLEFIPLTEHPFALAAPAGHPLLAKRSFRLYELVHYPLLLPGPSANCRPRLESLLRAEGIWNDLQVVLECSFPIGLLDYVDTGLGITITPVSPALLKQSQHGRSRLPGKKTVLRDISRVLGSEPVFFAKRRGWTETPIAEAFRLSLMTVCGKKSGARSSN